MAKRTRWLVLLLMMAAATPAFGDDAGTAGAVPMPVRDTAPDDVALAHEDRIAQLERTVGVLADELERERAARAFPEDEPLESRFGLGPAASKVYGVAQGLSVGGYGEARYTAIVGDSGTSRDRADGLRTVLYVGYKFSESIVFNSEFEWEHATTGSTESSGGGSISAEFAALDFLWKDWVNFRAGIVLVPMGYLNEIHEPPSYYGTHRPEVERQIIPSTWREVGTGVFGSLCEGEIEYSAYVINGMNAKGFRAGGLRGGRQKANRALAENLAGVLRIDWTPVPEFTAGGSVYFGESDQNQKFTVKPGGGMADFGVQLPDTPTTIWEVHAQYANQGWFFRALFTMAHVGNNAALTRALKPIDEGGIGELSSGEGIGGQMLGVYGEVAYDILPLLFPETEKSLSPFFRYEYYDTQRDMPSGYAKDKSKEIMIYTAGFSFKPIPNVVVKADYRHRSAAGGELADELNMGVGYAF